MPIPAPLTDADRYDAAIETGADLLKENLDLKTEVRRLKKDNAALNTRIAYWIMRCNQQEAE